MSEITVPMSSISAKPFTDATAIRKSTSAVIAVTTFAVENRVEALLVTGRDRGAHGSPGAHFFLDSFEHDDIRVGRDTIVRISPAKPGSVSVTLKSWIAASSRDA